MLKKCCFNSLLAAVITAAFLSVILEVLLFNFRSLQPMEDAIDHLSIRAGEGIIQVKEGFVFVNKEDGTEYDRHILTLTNINAKVDNLYLKLDTESETNDIILYGTDESNALAYELGSRVYVDSVEASHYMQLHFAGKAGEISLSISGPAGTCIGRDGIALNVRKPFKLSFLRIFAVFLLLLAALCTYCKIHIPYCSDCWYKPILIGLAICIQLNFFGAVVRLNPAFTEPSWYWHKQYQELAHSLLEGKVYVYDDAPQCLIDMENPYDTNLRKQVMKQNDASSRWDTAFYDGKYYVYFGVVPVIFFYIPFYLLTDTDLPNHLAVLYAAVIFILAVYGLVGAVIKKYYKNTSLLSYLLITTCIINGGGYLGLVIRPDLYAVPIAFGVAFTVLGLFLWMEASIRLERWQGKLLLTAGALSMALVAGCRPQLLLGSFVAVWLFGNDFLQGIKKRDKETWLSIAAFALPYVLVAAFLMWYNAVRFDSPFDFGASYNLTTNDMTGRSFEMDRNGRALFFYLFQPPYISAVFPFLRAVRYDTTYLGYEYWEQMYGGVIASNMFAWAVFFFGTAWRQEEKKKRGDVGIIMWLLLSGLILVIVDAQMGGVLQRYFSDVGIFIMLSAAFLWLCFLNRENQDMNIKKLLFYTAVFTMAYNVMMIFVTGSTGLNNKAPEVYYTFYHLIQFWM